MVATVDAVDIAACPPAPRNPLSWREQVRAVRQFHTGFEELRDAGGPVTRLTLGPRRLVPSIVVVTSPRGGHDMLGRTDEFVEKSLIHREVRQVLGGNLFDLEHEAWLPRRRTVQPVFTKQRVRQFGGHMAAAAAGICEKWPAAGQVDLDEQCRLLTLRALGKSVLGIDLDAHSDSISGPLRVALAYAADRTARPARAPGWLPTPARRRARAASATLHVLAREILASCRRDPDREAPLVRALIDAVDPATGRPLADEEICEELIVFILAGHDTTATTLTHALWQLGRHPEVQERVRAEVEALGHPPATEDLPRLGYTIQVLHEALRLCPPAAGMARMAKRDIVIDGYRVEAGTHLLFGIWAVHRDPALWDDPSRFDPDRFAPSTRRDRWQFLPFGAGPRSCIGDHFAMLEAALALATVIARCQVESVREDFPVTVPFTVVAAAPVPARILAR